MCPHYGYINKFTTRMKISTTIVNKKAIRKESLKKEKMNMDDTNVKKKNE
jgi:hypothetical protein